MAAPTVKGQLSTDNIGGGSTRTINIPAGVANGDLIVAILSMNNTSAAPVTYPSGWVKLFDLNSTSNISTSAAYKVADGTEGGSFSVTLSNSQETAAVCYLIEGYDTANIDNQNAFNGQTSSHSVPSITPSGGTDDYLYLAQVALDTYLWSPSGYPSGYIGTGAQYSGTGGSRCGIMFAYKGTTGSTTESPSDFTIDSSVFGHASIIAIPPVAAPVTFLAGWAVNSNNLVNYF